MSGEDSLPASVARSVAARGEEVTAADQALVDLALRYAHQIEAGIKKGGYDATKALYLGPHLLKALGALGCTPESRAEVTSAMGPAPAPAGRDELSEIRSSRGRGA